LFLGVDQYYTNGIRVYWLFPKGDTIKLLQVVREFLEQIAQDENKLIRFSLSMGQEMYTPEDRYITILISNDRPYTDWLYGGISPHSVNRIWAGWLFQMAQLMDVSINYFFWGLSDLDFSIESKLRTLDVINLDTDAIR
jgi:hypothetical protein